MPTMNEQRQERPMRGDFRMSAQNSLPETCGRGNWHFLSVCARQQIVFVVHIIAVVTTKVAMDNKYTKGHGCVLVKLLYLPK